MKIEWLKNEFLTDGLTRRLKYVRLSMFQKLLHPFILMLRRVNRWVDAFVVRRVNPSVPIFVSFLEPTDLPVGARTKKAEITFHRRSNYYNLIRQFASGRLFIIFMYFYVFLLPLTLFSQLNYKVIPDVVYGHKAGMALTYDVFSPLDSANGAGIIHVVSGGWNSRYNPPDSVAAEYEPLLEAGFTVFALRHGSSPQFKVPEIVDDILLGSWSIHDHAATFGVDSARLGIYGGSSGGQLALMAGLSGTRHPVSAIVAFYAPTDLRRTPDFLRAMVPALDFDSTLAASVSPILFASPDDPPTLLIHGDKDYVVGLSQSQNMYDSLQAHYVDSRLIVYKGMMHGNSYGPIGRYKEDAVMEMTDWFRDHLLNQKNKETP